LAESGLNEFIICFSLWRSRDIHIFPTFYKDHFGIGLMSYEPGSGECRALINSKEQIETMLLSLGKLEGTTEILRQLREVHVQLEHLHDQRRSATN
jgi:hypothetical protein